MGPRVGLLGTWYSTVGFTNVLFNHDNSRQKNALALHSHGLRDLRPHIGELPNVARLGDARCATATTLAGYGARPRRQRLRLSAEPSRRFACVPYRIVTNYGKVNKICIVVALRFRKFSKPEPIISTICARRPGRKCRRSVRRRAERN